MDVYVGVPKAASKSTAIPEKSSPPIGQLVSRLHLPLMMLPRVRHLQHANASAPPGIGPLAFPLSIALDE